MDRLHLAKRLLTQTVRLARRLRSGAERPTTARPRRRPFRPALEALEERLAPDAGSPLLAVGAGPGGTPGARLYEAGGGSERLSVLPGDAGGAGGMRVALADLNADGTPDLVTAPGPGAPPWVRAVDGATGREIFRFRAYDEGFTGGVCVGAAIVNGEVWVVTGADTGGGPHVRAFDDRGNLRAEFMAFEDSFRGGVRVAVGADAAGRAVIAAGAGEGGGPHVRLFDAATGEERAGFFAYAPDFRGGVHVALGELDGRPGDELVTGAGAGGGPHVRVYSGADGSVLQNFFAGDPADRTGVRVTTVAAGPGGAPLLAAGLDGPGGPRVALWDAGAGRRGRRAGLGRGRVHPGRVARHGVAGTVPLAAR